jgi:hypothetical protein
MHERGAFTDARRDKPGTFEQASGGTLFLDEIGERPTDAQGNLHRVLEQRATTHVGGTHTRPVDARVIAATNPDLRALTARGVFRRDLFYLLSVLTVRVPPLPERGADLVLLIERFLRHLPARLDVPGKSLSPEARRALLSYKRRFRVYHDPAISSPRTRNALFVVVLFTLYSGYASVRAEPEQCEEICSNEAACDLECGIGDNLMTCWDYTFSSRIARVQHGDHRDARATREPGCRPRPPRTGPPD